MSSNEESETKKTSGIYKRPWNDRTYIKSSTTDRTREYDVEMILCFIDYKKGFNCVDCNQMWKILLEIGASEHFVTSIRVLYKKSESKVRINNDIILKKFMIILNRSNNNRSEINRAIRFTNASEFLKVNKSIC